MSPSTIVAGPARAYALCLRASCHTEMVKSGSKPTKCSLESVAELKALLHQNVCLDEKKTERTQPRLARAGAASSVQCTCTCMSARYTTIHNPKPKNSTCSVQFMRNPTEVTVRNLQRAKIFRYDNNRLEPKCNEMMNIY